MPRSPRFRPNPLVRRWLRGEPSADTSAEDQAWEVWLLRRLARDRILEVGGVMVDRAVLEQRFACVSDRCAPTPSPVAAGGRGGRGRGVHSRGRYRSCCADAEVGLTKAERRRLAATLGAPHPTWLEDGRASLCRPGGRCVFSRIDGAGRIRCRLHGLAKRARVERGALQPISCRLFPLIVVAVGDGTVALTVVSRSTWRLVGSHPPGRYPCLDERGGDHATFPLLVDSMAGDLDWVFGRGFAKALRAKARQPGS